MTAVNYTVSIEANLTKRNQSITKSLFMNGTSIFMLPLYISPL